MTALMTITPRGTALSRPSMTSATSSLYAVKFSASCRRRAPDVRVAVFLVRFVLGAGPRTDALLGGVAVPGAVAVGEERVLEAGDMHVVAVPEEVGLDAQPGRGEARPATCSRHYLSLVAGNDKRARDQDRDRAIQVVEAAWADGQVVEADRDKRVESLLQAQTMAESRCSSTTSSCRGRHRRRRHAASRRSRWTRPSRRRSRSAPAATWASGCCSS